MSNKRPRQRTINFLEELGWLLKNYCDADLPDELTKFAKSQRATATVEEFTPENPNIAFLVGVLPSLFMNREYFPKNEDIARFSEKILHIPITRFEKRSQYELIGRIVCEVTNLDDGKLSNLVKELKKYLPSSEKPAVRNADEWNEVIRRLSGD